MAYNPREIYIAAVTKRIMGAISVYLDPDMKAEELIDVEFRIKKVVTDEAMFPEDFRNRIVKK